MMRERRNSSARRRIGAGWALSLMAVLVASPAASQTTPPADLGVRMGHWHLNPADIEATKRMFVAMGGTAARVGGTEVVEFPGVTVHLHLDGKASPSTGGTVGSVVEHVGMNVRNVDEAIARWQAAGVPVAHSGAQFPQAWVETPDGLRIEILQTPDQEHPIQHHHVHFYVPEADIPAAQKWYADVFGAVPGMRGRFQAADIPGANLTFSAATGPLAGTRGRVLDHVGFEVDDLEAFCRRLEARSDVELERPCERDPATGEMRAYLYDPWGSYIGLTEGR